MSTVSHTRRKKEKLRVGGQVEAVERAHEDEKGSAIVLYLLPPAGP